ncbi:MAG: polysaccharide deacetylase family protein [Nitrospinota bacterium]|nr:polysaccharide deacetylase family protein [Nitrospinota bacterium]
MNILLRVDIDFSFCIRKGVPWLLDYFDKNGIKATFFSVMGPDTVSSHGKRIGKKGYIKRLISMNPLKMIWAFGPLFLLRGKLLPVSHVGKDNPDILKDIQARGHELGLHGYDHSWWADNWKLLNSEGVLKEFARANNEYHKIFGTNSSLWGSPNWRTVEPLYDIMENMNIKYSSNVRGNKPFLPKFSGKEKNVVELPISLPAIHELVQYGIPKKSIPQTIKGCLDKSYNMLVIHGYYEGLLERELFKNTVDELLSAGYKFTTLGQYYDTIRNENIEADGISQIRVPGGFGDVSCQEDFLQNNYFDLLKGQND